MQFKTIQNSFFFGALIGISILFLWMIKDFITIIVWAIILAIIFNPLHKKLLGFMPKLPALASILSIIVILIGLSVPLYHIGTLTIRESVVYYQTFTGSGNNTGSIDILEYVSNSNNILERFGISIPEEQIEASISKGIASVTNWLTSQAIIIGQNSFIFIFKLFIIGYILFFLFRHGEIVRDRLLHILPFGEKREKKLIAKFASITRATIKGTFVIAIIQGVIGGILFWIAGVSSPILWGIVMVILSVIPAVGPALVWIPVGAILLLTGNIWQGLLVIIGGALVVSMADNILRPILVGKDAEMPGVLILLSTFGGISVFGITGLVLGPIIAGFFLSMWYMFEEDNAENLNNLG